MDVDNVYHMIVQYYCFAVSYSPAILTVSRTCSHLILRCKIKASSGYSLHNVKHKIIYAVVHKDA